jgi:hypothetical protein
LAILCWAALACDSSAEQATYYVIAAWELNNPQVEVTQELRDTHDIPSNLDTRDEVMEFLFQRAAQTNAKSSAAFYNMGLFFLDGRDCEKAKQSFRTHLSLIPGEEDTTRLLSVIEQEGCAGASLFLAGMDKGERDQFRLSHPEAVAGFD